MRRQVPAAVLITALLVWTALPLAGQVRVTEGASKPFAHSGEVAKPRGPDPATFARFFVTAAAGSPGSYSDSGSSVQWEVPAAAGYQFPSVRLSISVAPEIFANDSDPSAASQRAFMSDLGRLNAHVRAAALDAKGQPLPGASTLALMLSPSESTFIAPQTTNSQSEAKAIADLALKHFGPIGGIVSTFESAFHRRSAIGEIAYQSAASEFGWMWYYTDGNPIVGLHSTAALFQVPASAAALRLSVDLISDWRQSGTWMKTYDIVMPLHAAAP